jgi:intein/homing endonuclease
MSTRIKIGTDHLEQVYRQLSDEGYTLDEISSEIDSEFRNFLYKQHSMDRETFQKLEELRGTEIDHNKIEYIDGKGRKDQINIEKNLKSAELTGLILGDGYLQERSQSQGTSSYRLVVTVHQDENRLQKNAKNLLYSLTDKQPSIHDLKDCKATQIVLCSKEIVRELKKLGLQPGDKIMNQVNVPRWIKDDRKYMKKCLRGLVDTDGTIYRQTTDGRIIIQFKNFSEPLRLDFKHMCASLGYSPSGAGKYTVQIAGQRQVQKFIDEIAPIKATKISF